jgi:AcrR family transcriptional regulator
MEYGSSMSEAAGRSPSPSTRRERKKERTRREIYDAAMHLFARSGFGAVTITEICEQADVGRGTFFLHFATKAALLYEFNEQVAEDFRKGLSPSPTNARDELRALVRHITIELTAQSEIMAAMLTDYFTSPPALTQATQQGTAMIKLVGEIIARGQETREFSRLIDPRLAAISFLATAASFISGHLFHGLELSEAEIQRQFLQITFQGLSPTEDERN